MSPKVLILVEITEKKNNVDKICVIFVVNKLNTKICQTNTV
jgi:hypothetical protein